MGLAYSDLDLGKSKAAIHESELAEKTMGDSAIRPRDSRHRVWPPGHADQGGQTNIMRL